MKTLFVFDHSQENITEATGLTEEMHHQFMSEIQEAVVKSVNDNMVAKSRLMENFLELSNDCKTYVLACSIEEKMTQNPFEQMSQILAGEEG